MVSHLLYNFNARFTAENREVNLKSLNKYTGTLFSVDLAGMIIKNNKMHISSYVIISQIVATVVQINCSHEVYILFTVPSGSGSIYGGRVNPSYKGNEDNMFEIGYNGYSDTNGMVVQSQSYDEISQQLLVQVEDLWGTLLLLKGSLCVGRIGQFHEDDVISNRANYESNKWIHGWNTGIKAVAMYDSQIYFMSFVIYGNNSSNYQNVIELRSFRGCEHYLDHIKSETGYTFDLLSCSEHIGTLQKQKNGDINVGGELKIANISGGLYYFTVVMKCNKNSTDYSEVVEVSLCMVTENGDETFLHTQQTSKTCSYIDLVQHSGGIDYKNNILCWSTIFQLHCGKLNVHDKTLSDVITVIAEGDVHDQVTCQVPVCIHCVFSQNVITGVAIGTASLSYYVIYFGCFRGAGMITINSDGSDRFVYTLTSNFRNMTVSAGSMISIEGELPACVATSQPESTKNNGFQKEAPLYCVYFPLLMLVLYHQFAFVIF